jgi:hypothetical protein
MKTIFGLTLPQLSVVRHTSYLCYFSLFAYNGAKHVLTIRVTWRVSCRRHELTYPLRECITGLCGVHVAHICLYSGVCCVFVFVFVLCFVCPVSLDCSFLIGSSVFSNINVRCLFLLNLGINN